jgi:hypothetical protein
MLRNTPCSHVFDISSRNAGQSMTLFTASKQESLVLETKVGRSRSLNFWASTATAAAMTTTLVENIERISNARKAGMELPTRSELLRSKQNQSNSACRERGCGTVHAGTTR